MKIKTLKLSDKDFYQSLKSALSFDEEDCLEISVFIVFVREALNPDKCVPPSFCGMLFVKHKMSS